jgi:hypothetical protein
MNQNGRMIKTTQINHMISPKGPMYIGMSLIIYPTVFLLRTVCFSYLTFVYRAHARLGYLASLPASEGSRAPTYPIAL